MPLPKIEVPNYKTKIISIPEAITYRPFLVKEEKILLTALAGEDENEIVNSIRQIVQNCIIKPEVNVDLLPMFDLEYLFITLRSKSIGSISEIGLGCPECEEQNTFEINLDEITIFEDPDHATDIELVENVIGVVMKYPTVELLAESENEDNVEELYSVIANCIDLVYTQEEEFKMDDYSAQEQADFFESLTQEHFLKIQTFFNTIPYTYYNLKYECEHCDYKGDMELRGINNFFT